MEEKGLFFFIAHGSEPLPAGEEAHFIAPWTAHDGLTRVGQEGKPAATAKIEAVFFGRPVRGHAPLPPDLPEPEKSQKKKPENDVRTEKMLRFQRDHDSGPSSLSS
jgi:hypothetical protein